MLFIWIMSDRRGKGCYLPEQKNWSDRLDISSGVLPRDDKVLLSVTAEEGRWKAALPENFQWEDGSIDPVEIQDGDVRKLSDGTSRLTMVVSRVDRSSMQLRKLRWPQGVVSVGKREDNTLCYQHRLVSSHHGAFNVDRTEIVYTDQSSNGTWVNGRLVCGQAVRLNPGDHLFIVPALHIMVFPEFLAVNQPEWLKLNAGMVPFAMQELPAQEKARQTSVWKEYHRAPRQIQIPDTDPIAIDGPIEKQRDRKVPTWLAVGPSLTMVMPMLVSSVVMGRSMGASLLMIGTSSLLSFMWAMLNRRYAEKDAKINEENRQKICGQYYAEMEETLVASTEREMKRLSMNYLSAGECAALPRSGGHRMWEKQPVHPDFLFVRIGTGEAELPNKITVPKNKIELVDDPLRHEPQRLKDSYSMMKDAPIVLDAKQHGIIGVLGSKMSPWLMQSMVVQLAAMHSYHDVRIVVLHDEADAAQWQFTHHLPHVYASDDRTLRLAVCGSTATHEVLSYLDNVFTIRSDVLRESQNGDDDEKEVDIRAQIPWYMIFVTDPRLLEDEPIMRFLGMRGLGFTLVMQASQTEQLPKECDLIIEAFSPMGTIFHSDGTMTGVRFETLDGGQMQQFARDIAPFRIKEMVGDNSIPSLVTFLETYNARRIEDIDICHNWNENHAWKSIRSILGFKSGGVPFVLDISDKNHGPHGLIAGTTGAGKSVLLQSFILSLSLNYSPSEVQFILIDYKGGGTSEDFRDLPHAAGVIDSLQGERTIFRALASIQGEIKRREAIFKESGVNNIDDYMKMFNADPTEPTLGHVIVIVDEFAELKKEQPDFMRELVSAARVGRSLGLHLVLATQKPGNSVSEEIDANTRFRICLRVASRSDSTEMLKRPEAAYLKGMGRCYVQVGNNEVFEQVQTSWSGAVYNPDALRPEEEPRILNEIGQPVTFPKKKKPAGMETKERREIDVVLDYISDCCKRYHYEPAKKMWLEEIAKTLLLEDVLSFFGQSGWKDGCWPGSDGEELKCVFGMADDVDTQRRIPAGIDFLADHNVLLTGLSGSGKTTMLQTVAVSLALRYSPEEVNLYVFSLTSHVLQSLQELPHVGEIVYDEEQDEQGRLIDMLYAESNRRKTLFRDMATDNFIQYNRSVKEMEGHDRLPAIVVLVDGIAKVREWDNQHMEDKLKKFYDMIQTSSGQGIFFVLSGLSKNELHSSKHKFVKGLTLRQNERADYAEALGARISSEWGGIREFPGRGLMAVDNKEMKTTFVYEMQVAVFSTTASDRARSSAVVDLGKAMREAWHGKLPKHIARIPQKPTLAQLLADGPEVADDANLLPMGYVKSNGRVFGADLHSFFAGVVLGPKRSGKTTWVKVTALAMQRRGAQVYVVGADDLAQWAEAQGMHAFRCGQQEWVAAFEDITKRIVGERSAQLKQAKTVSQDEFRRVSQTFVPVVILIDDLDKYVAAYPATAAMLANFLADNERIATYHVMTYATVSRRGFTENQMKEPFQTLRSAKRGVLLQGATNECDPFGVVYRLPRGVTYPLGEAVVLYDDDMYRLVLPQVEAEED